MIKNTNLAGQVYGELKFLGKYEMRGKEKFWKCLCTCSKEVFIRMGDVKNGHTKTCGHFIPNRYEIIVDKVSYVLVELTQCQYSQVDLDDWFDKLINYRWFAHWDPSCKHFYSKSYLRSGKGRRLVSMQGIIFDRTVDNTLVDHINSNETLDNRRSNLRPATSAQNTRNHRKQKTNTSGYIGVYHRKDSGTYMAHVSIDGKLKSLGTFPTAVEAAKVRDAAVKIHYGGFGMLNFPGGK